nr:TIC40 (TIC40) [Polytomella parva]|eukprot:CAMPEP_0175057716 /NCGR_PEP_ID=MMETSP0052_2-20121109/11420_1 /TAXON_ID=51329 ORGANISM="Polytomella parva, Strain SAG 63-3" /NCGR_SAMPLE_ID=MMETSP0052_2 /ASSEMBLY_ACC=CAM_ASM_000194 /LENGTH=219 /DNA_ID=CAMNT_0016322963 /DNA_START=151 /DNA_END=810 /DNA_ORIENTATION=-
MVELMAQSTQLQAMLLNALPPFMRSPDVIKQMLSDPEAKKKLATQISKLGPALPTDILERLDPTRLDNSFSEAKQRGYDPSKMFEKLMSHTDLIEKLKQPRIMMAFREVTQNPMALDRYKDDTEVYETILRIRDVLSAAAPPPGFKPAEKPVEKPVETPVIALPSSEEPAQVATPVAPAAAPAADAPAADASNVQTEASKEKVAQPGFFQRMWSSAKGK